MNILEARRRTLGGHILKKTAQGNPAIATDSLARMYPGITMQGWTEQDSTTGAQLFNISTAISGKYISDTNGREIDGEGTYASDYIAVSGLSNIICNDTQRRKWMAFYDAEKTYVSGKNGYGVPIPVPENAAYARFTIANDNIGSFMLNEGSILKPYEPYTGGHPSPSPDYPQEIVSSGSWNETAQKWEYEIEISNAEQNPIEIQTVTLQSDRPLTKWDKLEKRNGQWGWVYKSNEVVFDGSEADTWGLYNNGFYVLGGLKDIALDTTLLLDSLSDKFHYSKHGEYAYFRVTGTGSSYSPIFYYSGIADAESWKKFLTENNVSYLYPTEAETFVPLTTAEQEAMNALYTYRPTTVLSNQQGCQMALTYKTRKSMEVTE